MTMHYDDFGDDDFGDDALDRAIRALPLEEPPAGLRASILLTTAHRPAPAFALWELCSMGAIAAVTVWFLVLIVLGGEARFVHAVTAIASFAVAWLSNPRTAAWLAAGGATAIWLSLFTGFQPAALAARRVEPSDDR